MNKISRGFRSLIATKLIFFKKSDSKEVRIFTPVHFAISLKVDIAMKALALLIVFSTSQFCLAKR